MKPNWKNWYSEWEDFTLTRYNMQSADRMPTKALRHKQFRRCIEIDIEIESARSVSQCVADARHREAAMQTNWHEWMVTDDTPT